MQRNDKKRGKAKTALAWDPLLALHSRVHIWASTKDELSPALWASTENSQASNRAAHIASQQTPSCSSHENFPSDGWSKFVSTSPAPLREFCYKPMFSRYSHTEGDKTARALEQQQRKECQHRFCLSRAWWLWSSPSKPQVSTAYLSTLLELQWGAVK